MDIASGMAVTMAAIAFVKALPDCHERMRER